jgi:hypothetical protein
VSEAGKRLHDGQQPWIIQLEPWCSARRLNAVDVIGRVWTSAPRRLCPHRPPLDLRPKSQLPDEMVQAAWRMLEAVDTRCLSQVESPGFQALLRRVREASREAPAQTPSPAVGSLEDVAQLLAL